MTATTLRLLYIEDDEGLAQLLKRHLRRQNIDVALAFTGGEGRRLCEQGGFDAVLMDYNLPDVSGLELLNFCIANDPHVPVIVLTALGDETIAVDAVRAGAADYLVKDVGQAYLELLPLVVRSAISKLRLEQRTTQQQKAIELSESMFRQIASSIEQIFWITERDPYRLIYVSPAFEDIWDIPVSDLYETPALWMLGVHPEDRARVQESFRAFLDRPEQGYDAEFRVLRPDGEERWVRDRGAPVYDEDGRINRLSGIAEDITERRQAERELAASEERYRTFITQSSEGIWRFETRQPIPIHLPPDAQIAAMYREGYLAECNDAMARMYGFESASEIVGTPLADFMPDDNPANIAYLRSFIAGGYSLIGGESEENSRNGETLHIVNNLTGVVERGALVRAWGIQRDVTAQKRAEQALRGSEERLRLATQAAQIGTFDYDLVNDELLWDERTRALFAVPEGTKVTYEGTFLDTLHPDDRERLDGMVSSLLRGEASDFDAEYRVVGIADGVERWVHAKGRMVFDVHEGQARPVRFVGTVRDITPSKRAQRKAEFMAELEHAIREVEDPQRVMEIFTERLGRFMGVHRCAYAPVEADEDRFTILHDWTDGNRASTVGDYTLQAFGSRAVSRLRAGETLVIRDVDRELASEDGADMFNAIGIKAIITCPLIKEGRLRAMMAVHNAGPRDWTADDIRLVEDIVLQSWAYIERARAEQAIRKSEGEFRQLANAMPQMIWVARPDGYHEYYNRRWYEYTGMPEGSTDGEAWNDVFHPDDRARAMQRWKHSLATGEPYMIEYRLRRADGAYRWVLGLARAIRDEQGGIVKWYGTCTDIHDKIMLERELVEAKERAEEASLAKSEFLANMSHEIRTPMNAVVGLANLLAGSNDLPEGLREYVQTMQVSAQTLLSLINDLLDISKVEARTFELEFIPFSLARVIDEIAVMASVQARQKGLEFLADHEAVESLTLLGDPARIRQILLNLCSNAVKFTERGRVSLVVRLERRQGAQGPDEIADIYIAIADTGIGIPPGQREQIFEKFSQGDASINRKYGGTGLGLAITRSLVTMMGGAIAVDSAEHVGSTFTVHLPLPIAASGLPAQTPTPSTEHTPMNGRPRILLVEDYQPNILVATAFLEEFGYDCDTATNGRLAVEKVQAGSYAAILMDVQMHEMNGFDATRAIRALEQEEGRRRTPVIGMTAHALTGDREKCLEAGMDDYITKPFNPAELEDMLRRHTQS